VRFGSYMYEHGFGFDEGGYFECSIARTV
jgi:hypothetical protein